MGLEKLLPFKINAQINDIANQIENLENSGVDTVAREAIVDIAKQTNPKLENLVANGNYVDGTGWSVSGGATVTFLNNTCILTGGNNREAITTGGNNGKIIPIGHKIYARCYQTPPSGCTYHYLALRDTVANITSEIKRIIPPNIGVRTLVSGIITLDKESTYPRFQSVCYFPNAATAIGKIMIIEKVFSLDLTSAFGVGNEPTVEEMDELMTYFPDEWFNGEVDLTIMPYVLNRMKQFLKSDAFIQEMHDKQLQANKINELTEKLNVANRNLESIYRAKNGTTPSSQKITVKNIGRQKMILHLHKRANNGYDTANDVYLPNAENDFADVRIKTDTGETLPYYVIYNGNIDIIADERLGINHRSAVLTDSNKNMIVGYNGRISKSIDNGFTWETITGIDIENARAVKVLADDTLLFAKNGVLYRSESPYLTYTQVLDITESYTGLDITTDRIVQHPDGELFLGAYQNERIIRIYKSTDAGLTWNLIYNLPETYQHVHSLFVDTNQTPIAIYAGVDGGGGVLKSTDKGATWVDLKSLNPNMPQATDKGVIYSSSEGYRLLGGETAIVGGYSIIKTTDDLNYTPVLGIGNSVFQVEELNGKLIASGNSAYRFKNSLILISEDDGETWTQAYTTQPLTGVGANDGFRYMAKDIYSSTDYEQIIVGCQSPIVSPLRIISGEDTYYAEVIVEVPDGCTELTIESGYLCSNRTLIGNDFEYSNKKIISLALNEGGQYIKESVSGKIIEGNFQHHNVGKHLSYNYPYIVKVKDRQSIKLKSFGGGIDVDISLQGLSAFTISFWGRFGDAVEFEIISRANSIGNDNIKFWNHALYNGNTQIGVLHYPKIPQAFSKFDIVVDVTTGVLKSYVNGLYVATSNKDISALLTNLASLTSARLLRVYTSSDDDCIQHFNIYEGAPTDADIYNSYNDYISDNQH